MRVLIVSDTHRKNDSYMEVIQREKPVDMVIHCGDVEGSEYAIEQAAGCPCHIVMGNNDFFADLPKEIETEIEGYRVLITHGHYYRVNMSYEILKDEARARGFDVVMFGHTHRPLIEIEPELVTINPGSLSYPRQEGRQVSYAIMEIDDKGDAHYSLHYL